MRKVVVTNNITLDGVMQAPGGVDEDLRGNFRHGGWSKPYNDEVRFRAMAEGMGKPADMLFGRRTYENFFQVWHGRTDNPFSPVLDNAMKYVASTTLQEPLQWKNSALLTGDVAAAVAKLKQSAGNDLVILGSGVLIQSLLRANLVDQLVLSIHPLVLGDGRRLFADVDTFAKFRLTKSVPTTTGVIIATYEYADNS